MDVFGKCFEDERPRGLRQAGLYSYFRTISSAQEPEVVVQGRRVVMLGSNNYLGLTNHPEVKEAAARALARYGTGCAGSRLLNGTLDLHVELEARIAAFLGRPAALTFPTGYQVNLGVLSCLLGRHDVAVIDSLAHACIIDGARLAFARNLKFRHNDVASLAQKLESVDPNHGCMIVVEGVYSMEGDLCPLPEVVALKERRGARLFVDDAHGVGVFGAHGRGVAEHFGVEAGVDLVTGTFSKALATVGGFVVGDEAVIDFIRHHARSEIFSAALPPASAAAALCAIGIVEREPERRERLWENTRYMKRELDRLGFETGDSQSPVVPIVVGEDRVAFEMVSRLQEEGVFANGVISPAVPPGRAMLRTSYMATHTREHLDRALEVLGRVGREFGLLPGYRDEAAPAGALSGLR